MASTKDREESKSRKILKIMLKVIGACVLIALCLVAIVCLKWRIDGAIEQKEYERTIEAAENQARVNIDKYINEKYGFIPEIEEIETKWEPDGDIFSSGSILEENGQLSERTTALCSHDGKQFVVMVTNSSDSLDGACDNYQEDEIREAIHKRIEEITGQTIECYFVEYGASNYQFLYYGVNEDYPYSKDSMIHNKFDKDLGAVFNDIYQASNRNQVTFVCSSVDFSNAILIDEENNGVERLEPEVVKEWFGSSGIDVSIFNLTTTEAEQEVLKEMQGENSYKLHEIFDYNDERIMNEIFYIAQIENEHENEHEPH